ncbi:MAG: hypothetical protein CL596_06645 [Alteromonas sp.]|nr:hypothetical protein [Alteromonas sp.]MAY23360.1 hypothetical protein [Flavobacteriaceae bacterium]|tara:strand:- start:7672 stop:8175 length:504 start_codon:yes stop_codon:yes gene_type:complete
MRFIKIALVLSVFPILLSVSSHKFYVSTTKIEYVAQKQSLQIISKLFIDDIEDVLQERYDSQISLATKKERKMDEEYLKNYVLEKLKIWADGEEVSLKYIGRQYEIDMVELFIEVTPVTPFETITVENKMLFELTHEQQNIVHVKWGKERQSLILDFENPNGLLNFN